MIVWAQRGAWSTRLYSCVSSLCPVEPPPARDQTSGSSLRGERSPWGRFPFGGGGEVSRRLRYSATRSVLRSEEGGGGRSGDQAWVEIDER